MPRCGLPRRIQDPSIGVSIAFGDRWLKILSFPIAYVLIRVFATTFDFVKRLMHWGTWRTEIIDWTTAGELATICVSRLPTEVRENSFISMWRMKRSTTQGSIWQTVSTRFVIICFLDIPTPNTLFWRVTAIAFFQMLMALGAWITDLRFGLFTAWNGRVLERMMMFCDGLIFPAR